MDSRLKSIKKDEYKKKWLFLGIIWVASLCLFVWNINRIGTYYREKNRIEETRKINSFIESHMSQFKQILKEKERFYDHISSAKIGIIRVEEIINKLANKNNISISHMEKELLKESNKIKLNISFNGAIDRFIKMLSVISTKYPFIQAKSINIKFVDNKNGKYEVIFLYNYIIEES